MVQAVQQRPNDPYLYLYVMGEWYCYNPADMPLGSGAMGDVYKGVIAVKRVKDAFANNKMIRERAKQEASLAFRHPNLVEMIGYCEYAPETGPIFILSNFVQGKNIDEYVKGFKNSPHRTEKICGAICAVLDALDYVHSRGVIHRDIKPSNIMIENDSNVRLMDLGIARMNAGNKFSSFGFIGTPEYSAPEQMQREQNGAIVQINATTDIYELGITFYELLNGSNPMSCNTEVETMTRQMKEDLPASERIPKKLMKVIWKATEKEQSKRYQTALDFKHAIQAALLPEPSKSQQIMDWIQENAMMLLGGVTVLAVLIFVIVILLI